MSGATAREGQQGRLVQAGGLLLQGSRRGVLRARCDIDAVAPSPDGAHVAVLTHSFAGEYSDGYPVTIHDAASLAAKAYNAEGLAQLKAEQLPRVAALFKRVAALEPSAWKGPYNLACAHARAGAKDEARAALEEAIRRGGESVRKKLPRDRDLDRVRDSRRAAADEDEAEERCERAGHGRGRAAYILVRARAGQRDASSDGVWAARGNAAAAPLIRRS